MINGMKNAGLVEVAIMRETIYSKSSPFHTGFLGYNVYEQVSARKKQEGKHTCILGGVERAYMTTLAISSGSITCMEALHDSIQNYS